MDEQQKVYKMIAEKLQEPFPEGTVQESDYQHHVHIPVQAYIKRLEEVAGGYWSWELVGEPVIYEKEEYVMVIGRLTIAGASRTGIGFSQFKTYEDTGKIQQFKSIVNSAESDALRNACDKFLMGWKDLAPYRKWASNPGVGLQEYVNRKTENNHVLCIRCNKMLSAAEQNVLKEKNIRLPYCDKHIPAHLLK